MSTKSLAKELGLIRSRRHSSAAHPRVRKQRFPFLIIIDFESTCWREKNSSGQEIIEFPAVLLNVSSGEVESEFHTFVQPQEHPVLSEFCTELTGITQDQVDSAPPLHICLSRFVRWLLRLQQERGVVFETDSTGPAPSGHPCAFVTWSDWDLGVCLLYECKRKQLSVPEALKSWIDLRATYRLFYNRKPKGLRGALLDLGIQFTGREHSGLVDARNTALLAWRMVCDGCLLSITKSLRRAPVKPRPPLGNISSVCRPAPSEAQTSVCRALVAPRTVLSSTSTPRGDRQETSTTALAGLSDTTYDPETPDACWTDGVLLTEEEEPVSYDDVALGAEPDENIPSVSAAVFKTPKPLARSDPYGPLSRFLGRSSAPFSVYRDPPIAKPRPPLSGTGGHSSKRTAPLCGCGRRARRLTVGNGGPNHGRGFYSCPARRQTHTGCGLFQWESGSLQSRAPNQIRAAQAGVRALR